MIKIILVFLLLFTSQLVIAQSTEDLYQKVFGKSQESKRITVDVSLDDFYLGQISANVIGNQLQTISGSELTQLLSSKIRENKKSLYDFNNKELSLSSLSFQATYIASEVRLKIIIPISDLAPQNISIHDELIPYYATRAKAPAPISFSTNYKIEDVQNSNFTQPNSLNAQVDSYLNLNNITVENQANYLSIKNRPWYRQNTKLTFDRPQKMQRFEAGDVSYPTIGFQQNRPLGGVSFFSDFSLNPYKYTGPTSLIEYEIETRSLVKTYINGILLKTEYMNPGPYSTKDIPLNNGVNNVTIEITDDFGKKKILTFNEPSSIDSLAVGLSKYSIAAGPPSTDNETSKKYEQLKNTFYSGFYQYGLNKNWSAGSYIQGNNHFFLIGADNTLTSNIGNFNFDLAESKLSSRHGEAYQLNYQLNLFGNNWNNSHTLYSKIEYRTSWFNEQGTEALGRFDILTSLSYGIPIFEKLSMSFGGNYQHPRILNDNAQYGFNGSLSSRIYESNSLTVYFGKNRDSNKNWNTLIYFFLNIATSSNSTYASAFYENASQSKKLTLIRDTGKKVDDLKISSSIDENNTSKNGSLDLQYNTHIADIGIREEVIHPQGQKPGNQTSLRILSAFAFIHDNENNAFSISRPISNSFVIFKPISGWENQHFGVQSNGFSNDTKTGLFNEALISEFTEYQYRRIQIDPSSLEPGYSLGQESFVIYPKYHSGHLFMIGEKGTIVLRGNLFDKNQRPISLKVGYLVLANGKTLPFFTGRDGEFLIDGVEPSISKIQIDDESVGIKEINLTSKKPGIIDLGNIELPSKEGRL